MKPGDLALIEVRHGFVPECQLQQITKHWTLIGKYTELFFEETEEGRTHFTRILKIDKKKWYRWIEPLDYRADGKWEETVRPEWILGDKK